ncbi:MAG: tetratricopeptide repeat protein, partial [Bdellovibrionales bacterium]|nr:tetratricopeptide repeat protein [Bdellovibrionales bacterium]
MKNLRTNRLLLICFAGLSLTQQALATIRVGFAPTIGTTSQPKILYGIEQVVRADIAQTGEFEPVRNPGILGKFRLDSSSEAAGVADVVVQLAARDTFDHLEIIVRATDPSTGYNLGSQRVEGQFQNVKLLQDRVSSAVFTVLRSSVPPTKQTQIFKGHIKEASTLHMLGDVEASLDKSDMSAALEALSEAREKNPESSVTKYHLETLGTEYLKNAKAADDRGYAYLYLRDLEKSLKEFDVALKANPKNQRALLGKAEAFMLLGRTGEAAEYLKQAQLRDPRNPKISNMLGKIYMAYGKRDLAISQYESASKQGSQDPGIYESLGHAYARKNQLNNASAAFIKAADLSQATSDFRTARILYAKAGKINPNANVVNKEIEVLIKMGELDLAMSILNRRIIERPDNDYYRAKVGQIFMLKNQPDLALKRLKEAYEMNPRSYEANLYMGVIYKLHYRNPNQAIKFLEAALNVKPEEVDAGLMLAELYLEQDKTVSATVLLEKLIRIHPHHVELKLRLGDAFYRHENYASAKAAYSKVIEIIPDHLEAHEGLAKVYIQQGDVTEALAELDKVYALDATGNYFVREGVALLEKLTSRKLIELSLRFPKMVSNGTRDIFINQIAVVPLEYRNSWDDYLKDWFSIYVVDRERLRKELEIAIYSRYRIIRPLKFKYTTISKSEFNTPASMEALAKDVQADGIFVFDILNSKRGPNTDQVKVDLMLFSSIDGSLHGIPDPNTIEPAFYPKNTIIVLNKKAPGAYLLCLCLFGIPFFYFGVYRVRKRGWGTVKVVVNYDPKLESFLTLKLSTKEESLNSSDQFIVRDKEKYKKKKYKELLKQKGTWVKQMVGRTTVFEKVPARDYYCYLFGTIEDTGLTKKTVGNYSMAQKITLGKGEFKEVIFELEKKEAYVTVFVLNNESFISGAEIRCSNSSEMKFSRGDTGTFFYLPVGDHTISVNHEGKTYSQKILIRDLQDRTIHFDLRDVDLLLENQEVASEKVVAVAENLEQQGRHDEASKLYEKAGQHEQ